jgi:exopolysaccharide biosynthesis polyprenyl glycosylphosphotransferase
LPGLSKEEKPKEFRINDTRMKDSFSNRKPASLRLRPSERRLILLLGDLAVTIISLLIALYFWSAKDFLHFSLQFLSERTQTWFYFLPIVWLVLLVELYDVRRASRRSDTVKGVAIAAVVSLGLYLLYYFTSDPNSLPRTGVAVFIIACSLLTLAWRFFYISVFTAPMFMRRILMVGAGRAGTTLANIVKGMWPPPFFMVGYIDDDPAKRHMEIGGFPVLGTSEELDKVIAEHHVTDLVLAISGDLKPEMFQALMKAEEDGVELTTMPIVYEELLGRVPIFLLESDWILRSFVDQAHANGFYEMSKRILDVVGGLFGVLGLGLLFPFIALAILLDTGFPILFLQNRLGKNGKIYKIIKFRTMRRDAEQDGKARVTTANDDRVTRAGRFLRKSHLDELPQFINVLRGEMSLVGPRAERSELVDDLQKRIPFYRARLLVKPGITGWAQVNFGYAATVEDTGIKLEYDLYYIKHRDLLQDLIILIRTVGTVVGFRGQ